VNRLQYFLRLICLTLNNAKRLIEEEVVKEGGQPQDYADD